MTFRILAVILWCVSAIPTMAQVVFEGFPDTRVEAGSDGAKSLRLTADQRMKNRVVIERRGDSYFWSSRGGVELVRRVSGIYEIFIAQTGAGYIKIEQPIREGQPFRFLEHVHLSLVTITYFGSTFDYAD